MRRTCFKHLVLFCRAPSESSPTAQRPHVAADSEVYKMLQENQESDEPPRQSASFRVLQEILETGADPGFMSFIKDFFVASQMLLWFWLSWNNACMCVHVSVFFCRWLWQAIRFPKCESPLSKDWVICGECTEAACVWQVWIWDCVSTFNRRHVDIFSMMEVDQSYSWLQ